MTTTKKKEKAAAPGGALSQQVLLIDIVPDKSNNRSADAFKGEAFDGLVASIKAQGVLQPLIVRSHVQERYVIVAGHRRYHAAKAAGLQSVPCNVLQLTDEEAKEIQIVENLQRADVHPLDEANAYKQLALIASLATADIAARVSKSETYVRDRLVLNNLADEIAAQYRAGKLRDGHAAVIARLAPKDQAKAWDRYRGGWEETLADFKDWVKREFYNQLSHQPWLKDEKANAAVGKCVECQPNVATLFGQVKVGECTSHACWERKMAAYIEYCAKQLGMPKISVNYGQPAKGVLARSEYAVVEKKDTACSTGLNNYAVIAEGSEMGKRVPICVSKGCTSHRVGVGGSKDFSKTPAQVAKEKAERRKLIEKEKAEVAARTSKIRKALKRVSFPFSKKHLNALLEIAFENAGADARRTIAKRHELKVEKKKHQYGGTYLDYDGALRAYGAKASDADKARLVFELLVDYGRGFRRGFSKI